MANFNRRDVLCGMMNGAAITVGLPLLDCFLNGNGEALASGAPIPTRFATWFWGCGINEKRFFPDATGTDFEFKEESMALKPFKDKLTIFSGFNANLDGKPNLTHWSGLMCTIGGTAPSEGGNGSGHAPADTIDCLISDHIGSGTRFKSLQLACVGDRSHSYSMRAGNTVNPAEVDPVALYKRIFVDGFQDPNSGVFKPDPKVIMVQSALSSVKDGRAALMKKVGAEDRARLDQYFTSLREMEQQLAIQLQPPAPAEGCVVPKQPADLQAGMTWDEAIKMHDVLTTLGVMALSCNQTRVLTICLSGAVSLLRKAGESQNLHGLSHEEPVDPVLGYQPQVTYFLERAQGIHASFLQKLDAVKEGNGTLLDHSLVLAFSESNLARFHTLSSLPLIVSGTAGGKWKQGQHINGKGDTVTRVGLTIQQVLGMPVGQWGTGANQTSKPVTEVIA